MVVKIRAHAKVNLTLEVLGRRTDGYHELRSWMVPLGLSDRLRVARARLGVSIEVVGAPDLAGPDNLAVRAARAFQERFGRPAGVRLRLEKRIPVAAGLGGGSSDAAATLRALARLEGIREGPALLDLARTLGSDVPFFLGPGAALVFGRGERVVAGPRPPALWLLLLKPPFGLPAAEAYAAWAEGHRERAASPLTEGGADASMPRVLLERFTSARTAAGVERLLVNDLESGVLRRHPELRSALGRLQKVAGGRGMVSGSGSTCFSIFARRDDALRARDLIARRPGERLFLTRTVVRHSPPLTVEPTTP